LCDACGYRWIPCSDRYCRGYRVKLAPFPAAVGCPECDQDRGGVPTTTVVWWPEAYHAIARELKDHDVTGDNNHPPNDADLLGKVDPG
jgi:hypothetical protein